MNNIMFFISNNLILSIIWFFLFSIIIFLTFNEFFLKAKLINSFYAIKLINEKNAKIIDTRSLELYNSGHIINAIHMPLKKISLQTIKDLNLSNIIPIIFIINSSENYNKYIKKFINCGVKNVYVLKNGMESWNIKNLPVITNDNHS